MMNACFKFPLAALFWDPNPNVFVVPYFDHPLRWYGLLFALGFVAAFWLIIPLISSRLLQTRAILPRDIGSWPSLIETLQTALKTQNIPLHVKLGLLDKSSQQLILNAASLPTPQEQSAILKILTDLLNTKGINRQILEKLLPNVLTPVSTLAYYFADRLLWFIVIGTIIGARLGHVFLYEWPYYSQHPAEIFKIWEGGLASHGGTLGVLLAAFFCVRYSRKDFPEISFMGLCDLMTIPTALGIIGIRLGNFMNQEILGTPSSMPWAIIFGHPADGSMPIPRHPVQLYEAISYLATFIILRALWKSKSKQLPDGFMTGLFFVLVFGTRFVLEFFKAHQPTVIDESILQAGQWLSIPFILLGFGLMLWPRCSIQKKMPSTAIS